MERGVMLFLTSCPLLYAYSRRTEMDIIEHNPLRLTRAGVTMAVWGVVLLLAGVYNQYQFPSVEAILGIWGAITLIGLAVQVACEIKHAAVNFYVWLASVAVAWLFTLYVTVWDNGAHGALYPDLPGVWLIFLGLGYVDTARRINSRFVWIGVVHIVAGIILEIVARGIIKVDFLSTYSTLIFGIVAGGTLIVGSTQSRLKAKAPQPKSTLSVGTTG
jgi:hypothetical protein